MTTAESTRPGRTADPGRHARPEPTTFGQWVALTGLMIRTLVKGGDLVVAIVTPLVFTVGFYLPLRLVMKLQGLDYAQFVMAIIVLQTMSFTMMSTAQFAAVQARTGFTTRLKTMPVSPLVPVAARATNALFRSAITLTAALVFGYVIGFRLNGGLAQSALFCVFALAVGAVLSIGADALGTLTASPEAVSQALTLPTLIFGMLSTGFVPESGFPAWIRPFARNQPISQFAVSMRDMSGPSGVTFHTLWPSLLWIGGAACVLVPLAIWASVRRE